MLCRKRSPYIIVIALAIGLVWIVVAFAPNLAGRDEDRVQPTLNSLAGGPSAIRLPVKEPPTGREVALDSAVVAVVEVIAADVERMGPAPGGNQPVGLGVPYTLYTVRISRVVKSPAPVGDAIAVLREGALGIPGEDEEFRGPPPEIGLRYFLTARPRSDASGRYYPYPLDSGFTLILSQTQEENLVREYEGYLGINPGTPESSPVVDDPPVLELTATIPLEPTVTVVAPVEPSPIVVPTVETAPSETSTVEIAPTATSTTEI